MDFVQRAKNLKGKAVLIRLLRESLIGTLVEIDNDLVIIEIETTALESDKLITDEVFVPLASIQYIRPRSDES